MIDKILSTGLFLVGGFWAVSHFLNRSSREQEQRKTTQQAEKQARQEGQSLSFPPGQYKFFADQIYEAVRYSWIDDDKDQAEAVLLQMQNDLDLIELIKAYGYRQKYLIFGSLTPDGDPMNLPQTVRDELYSGQVNRINQAYMSRGIKYRF